MLTAGTAARRMVSALARRIPRVDPGVRARAMDVNVPPPWRRNLSRIGRLLGIGLLLTGLTTFGKAHAGDNLAGIGLLPVTEFGARPDDDADDTRAINAALAAARDQGKVTYLPAGRYIVSDTLACSQPATHRGKRWWSERRLPCTIEGPRGPGRAVLQLADDAPGFGDATSPKPLIWFWAEPVRGENAGSPDPNHGAPSISFNQTIRNLDIDLRAAGNAGAIGIRHAGSQGSTIADVTIEAAGAFAGLSDTPGQGGGVYGLTVNGGRYGVYATGPSRYPLLVGSRFRDQQQAAVSWTGNVLLVMVGFHIEKQTPGPAISLASGGPVYGRGMTLIDGVIDSKGPTAIDNSAGRSLTLHDVTVRGSETLVQSGRGTGHPRKGEWSRVVEYAFTPASYVAVVDGVTQAPGFEIARIEAGGPPDPAAAVRAHLWPGDFPHAGDPGLADVRAYGAVPDDAGDDTDAIQKALDENDTVLLPKGVFVLDRPLRLGPKNRLLGIGKTLSVLREGPNWRAEPGSAMITTVDDRAATTTLSDLLLETRSLERSGIEWRAGSASIVREVMVGPLQAFYGRKESGARNIFRLLGNGGGRWYGMAAEWGDFNGATHHPDYAHLLVDGTTQPLAFYGLNIERDAVWPQAEIRNAENVDFYYLKVEATAWPKGAVPPGVLKITNSRDIRLFGLTGNARPPDAAIVELTDSSDYLLTQIAGFQPAPNFANILERRGGQTVRADGSTPVTWFRRSNGGG